MPQRELRESVLINMASVCGRVTTSDVSAYVTRKFAVTITSLMPGATDTEFFERADMLHPKVGAGQKNDPAQVAREGFETMMAREERGVAGSPKSKVQGRASDFPISSLGPVRGYFHCETRVDIETKTEVWRRAELDNHEDGFVAPRRGAGRLDSFNV